MAETRNSKRRRIFLTLSKRTSKPSIASLPLTFRTHFQLPRSIPPRKLDKTSKVRNATGAFVVYLVLTEGTDMYHFDRHDELGRMTEHAVTRCNQRGIRTEVVGLVLAHFDRDCHAGAGAAAISISRARLAELQRDGIPAAVVDRACHAILIMSDDGAIITAINRPIWFARFHHGAERLGHRRRLRRRSRHSRSFR